jgi:nucleotide-binding universal stress UspA family protein
MYRWVIKLGEQMFKTILVPLDGSKRAEKILPYVEDLAHARESRVVLLRVIEPVNYISEAPMEVYHSQEKTEIARKEAKADLASLAEHLRIMGIIATSRVEEGEVAKLILEVAEDEKADLIAMASHGRTGLPRVFYGSVAAGILNQTEKPLLLIRAVDSPQATTEAQATVSSVEHKS